MLPALCLAVAGIAGAIEYMVKGQAGKSASNRSASRSSSRGHSPAVILIASIVVLSIVGYAFVLTNCVLRWSHWLSVSLRLRRRWWFAECPAMQAACGAWVCGTCTGRRRIRRQAMARTATDGSGRWSRRIISVAVVHVAICEGHVPGTSHLASIRRTTQGEPADRAGTSLVHVARPVDGDVAA